MSETFSRRFARNRIYVAAIDQWNSFRRIEDPIDPRSIRIAEAEGNQNARSSSTEPRVFAFSLFFLLRKKSARSVYRTESNVCDIL